MFKYITILSPPPPLVFEGPGVGGVTGRLVVNAQPSPPLGVADMMLCKAWQHPVHFSCCPPGSSADQAQKGTQKTHLGSKAHCKGTAFPCYTLKRNWSRGRALKGWDVQTKNKVT